MMAKRFPLDPADPCNLSRQSAGWPVSSRLRPACSIRSRRATVRRHARRLEGGTDAPHRAHGRSSSSVAVQRGQRKASSASSGCRTSGGMAAAVHPPGGSRGAGMARAARRASASQQREHRQKKPYRRWVGPRVHRGEETELKGPYRKITRDSAV